MEFSLASGERIKFTFDDCVISNPEIPIDQIGTRNKIIYPTECRQLGTTYSGQCTVTLQWYKNDIKQPAVNFDLGQIPIMVKVCFKTCEENFHIKITIILVSSM